MINHGFGIVHDTGILGFRCRNVNDRKTVSYIWREMCVLRFLIVFRISKIVQCIGDIGIGIAFWGWETEALGMYSGLRAIPS